MHTCLSIWMIIVNKSESQLGAEFAGCRDVALVLDALQIGGEQLRPLLAGINAFKEVLGLLDQCGGLLLLPKASDLLERLGLLLCDLEEVDHEDLGVLEEDLLLDDVLAEAESDEFGEFEDVLLGDLGDDEGLDLVEQVDDVLRLDEDARHGEDRGYVQVQSVFLVGRVDALVGLQEEDVDACLGVSPPDLLDQLHVSDHFLHRFAVKVLHEVCDEFLPLSLALSRLLLAQALSQPLQLLLQCEDLELGNAVLVESLQESLPQPVVDAFLGLHFGLDCAVVANLDVVLSHEFLVEHSHQLLDLLLLIGLVEPAAPGTYIRSLVALLGLLLLHLHGVVLVGQEGVEEVLVLLAGEQVVVVLGLVDHFVAVEVLDHRVADLQVVGVLRGSGQQCHGDGLALWVRLLLDQEVLARDELAEGESALEDEFAFMEGVKDDAGGLDFDDRLVKVFLGLILVLLGLLELDVVAEHNVGRLEDGFQSIDPLLAVLLAVLGAELLLEAAGMLGEEGSHAHEGLLEVGELAELGEDELLLDVLGLDGSDEVVDLLALLAADHQHCEDALQQLEGAHRVEGVPVADGEEEGDQQLQVQVLALEVDELDEQVGRVAEDGEDQVVLVPSLELVLLRLQVAAVVLDHLLHVRVLVALAEHAAQNRVLVVVVDSGGALPDEDVLEVLGLLETGELGLDGVVDGPEDDEGLVEEEGDQLEDALPGLLVELLDDLVDEEDDVDDAHVLDGRLDLDDLVDEGDRLDVQLLLQQPHDVDLVDFVQRHQLFNLCSASQRHLLKPLQQLVALHRIDLQDVLLPQRLEDALDVLDVRADRGLAQGVLDGVNGGGEHEGEFELRLEEDPALVLLGEQVEQLLEVVLVVEVLGAPAEGPLVHVEDDVLDAALLDDVELVQSLVLQQPRHVLDEFLPLEDDAQVDQQRDVGLLVPVDLPLHALDLLQQAEGLLLELLPVGDFGEAALGDLVGEDLAEDEVAGLHDFLDGHVDGHVLEACGLVLDVLHDVELGHDVVVAVEGDVLDVDHDLVHGDVVLPAQLELQLHRLHQHLVDAVVLLVELGLLVVDPVEDELEVRDGREVRVEVGEEADVEDVRAVGVGLLVDGLDLLEQAVLLDLLVVEEVLEEVLVVELEEGGEVVLVRVGHLLVVVVDVEALVEEGLVLEVRGEELVLLLQEVDHLVVVGLVVLAVLVELGDEEVEGLLRVVLLVHLQDLALRLVHHVVRGQPVPLEPQRVRELAQRLLVVDVLEAGGEERLLPLLGPDVAPDAVVESGLEFLVVEVAVDVGEEFGDLVEEVDDLVLGGLDDLLEQVLVDDAVGELEVLGDDADHLRVVLEVEEHVPDLVQQERLHVRVLEEVVVLDVDLQRLALARRVLRVDDRRQPLDDVDLAVELELAHEEVRGHEVLQVLLVAVGALDLLAVDVEASLLDAQDLAQHHGLLLELLLDLELDGLVVAGGEDVLVVGEGTLVRAVPDLEVDLLLREAHLLGHVVLLLEQLGVREPEADGLEDRADLLLERGGLAHFEVVGDLPATLVLLLLAVLEENGEVAVEGLQDGDVEGVAGDVADLDGVDGAQHDLLGLDGHVDGEVVDLHVLLGDVQDGLRVDVLQDLALLVDAHVDRVDQVAVLDGHDLVLQVHEDDLARVVLDAELALHVVHDVVDAVGLARADLLALEVDLQAPEDEALLVLLRLLEEHVDDVVDRGRDRQQPLLLVDLVALVQLLLDQPQVLDVVDLVVRVVEHAQQPLLQETHEPDLLADAHLAHQHRRLLRLHREPVEEQHGVGQQEEDGLCIGAGVLLGSTVMLSMGPFRLSDQQQSVSTNPCATAPKLIMSIWFSFPMMKWSADRLAMNFSRRTCSSSILRSACSTMLSGSQISRYSFFARSACSFLAATACVPRSLAGLNFISTRPEKICTAEASLDSDLLVLSIGATVCYYYKVSAASRSQQNKIKPCFEGSVLVVAWRTHRSPTPRLRPLLSDLVFI